MDKVAIYGAQGYALGACKAIKSLYPNREIMCFMVTSMGHNSNYLDNIPVRETADVALELSDREKEELEIYVATPEDMQPEIEDTLCSYGFGNYKCLDSEGWGDLMKAWQLRDRDFLPLSALPVGTDSPRVDIYMTKCHKDRELKKSRVLPDYIKPLQVGACYTDCVLAELADNVGDNISEKNVNYSELTGLYWIWKNRLEEPAQKDCYVGLGHYRRILNFSEDEIMSLVNNDVDVVLPFPMPYEPDINAHHERYLKDVDWNALLTALGELQPEYKECFPEVLSGQFMYNYNIVVAKQAVLREYCEWLFPILERTEELSVPRGKDRSDRYIGYMGEILETLYFMKNAERLNVVHTTCRFYI
ncbi:MAG: DUF4422 domain-containing protein [Eubacterium sp.]|nr:DUF4422 domain-containing protein [Eubacterium sp.]